MIHPRPHQSTAYECSPRITTSGACHQHHAYKLPLTNRKTAAHDILRCSDEGERAVDRDSRHPILAWSDTACTGSSPIGYGRLSGVRGHYQPFRFSAVAKVFRQAEIGQDRVAFPVDEHVLRLEVPDDNSVSVPTVISGRSSE